MGGRTPPREPDPTPRAKVVLRDVARAAGVSHQTVSRVLNEHPLVAPSTRARVLDAIRTLDYRPHATARALATGQTRTLGVITSDPTRYGPAKTVQSISEAAEEAGWTVSVVEVRSADPEVISATIERLTAQQVQGIITIAPYRAVAKAVMSVPYRIPMMSIHASPDATVPAVSFDNFGGAQRAVQHLLDLGHTNVWHISGLPDWLSAEERVKGWRAALEAIRVTPPPLLVGDWGAASGFEAGLTLAKRDDVTAVFASNDQMALGAMRALQENGRRIPEDVSVIGFDDIPEAGYLLPPLTTIRPAHQEVGRRCLAMILELIDGGSPASEQVVAAELVVRRSTAPPSS